MENRDNRGYNFGRRNYVDDDDSDEQRLPRQQQQKNEYQLFFASRNRQGTANYLNSSITNQFDLANYPNHSYNTRSQSIVKYYDELDRITTGNFWRQPNYDPINSLLILQRNDQLYREQTEQYFYKPPEQQQNVLRYPIINLPRFQKQTGNQNYLLNNTQIRMMNLNQVQTPVYIYNLRSNRQITIVTNPTNRVESPLKEARGSPNNNQKKK